ncbi:MAG: hypothetical protein ACOWWM_21375 [Desulfobacterales bacterium]
MAQTLSYLDAHLFVAGIRVLEHLRKTPPAVSDVCSLLHLSEEWGHFLSRNLAERGIIESVEGAYGTRLYIRDHVLLETIPKEAAPSSLQEELKRFQESQKGMAGKVATIKAEREEKRKSLFEEMEKKLKAELNKKS